ncbi:MAG: hypothetical protein AAFV95_11130 [Bacteroidota bacterium]
MLLRLFPLLTGIVFLLLSTSSLAQVPSNPIGLNPSSLKWKQINTDRLQVLFPEGLEEAGQYVANVVDYLWEHDSPSVGEKGGKVTMVLLNQGVLSNGLVTVGPFRSEMYTTPPQFDCTSDWLFSLTVHEYQHVKQFVNARRGITGLTRYVLGSWSYGGLMATALPRWYFEGDAVHAETALTRSGRGRLPAFNMEYRAVRESGRKYGYEKAAAGSLKDFVPDWYAFGHNIISYGRQQYGEDLWAKVLNDAVRYRGIFYPFSHSLKKHTGVRAPDLYEASMQALDSFYQASPTAQTDQRFEIPHRSKQASLSHYFNAQLLPDGNIIAEKRANHHLARFILIDPERKEKTLLQPGLVGGVLDSRLSYAADKICWAERAFDIRWANRDYSIIKVYNLKTKKTHKISSQSRYFAPTLSPDGLQVVTVEVDKRGQSQLVILDATTGYVVRRLENPNSYFYSFPAWSTDGEYILAVAKKAEMHRLQRIHIRDGQALDLSPAGPFQLSHPYAQGGRVYFSSAYTGTNNIFAVGIDGGDIQQVTDVAFGAFQPSASSDGSSLIYSAFTADGYRLEHMAVNPDNWTLYVPPAMAENFPFASILTEDVTGSIADKIGQKRFPTKRFRGISGIFRPHSFLPYLYPPVYGASILSDDKFSTMSISASTFYNQNDDDWTFTGELTYAAFFPRIRLGAQQSERSTIQRNFSLEPDQQTLVLNPYVSIWQERRLNAGVTIPLNLSFGRFFNSLRLSADYQYIDIDDDESRFDNPNNSRDTLFSRTPLTGNEDVFRPRFASGTTGAIDLRLNLLSIQRMALQNIRPRLGLNFEARYRRLLDQGALNGDVLSLRADLWLPGFAANHSITLNGGYQEIDELDNYRFPNFFVYPRGFKASIRSKIRKVGINYALPLFYPDVAVGPFAFLKRVKLNVFADYAEASSDYFQMQDFQSTGVELNVDFRALRLVEVDCGVRVSRISNAAIGLNEGQTYQVEFVLVSLTQ